MINLCLRFISQFGRFCEDFTLPSTLSLSIPFTSLYLSYLSLPLYISPSTFLSIILFGVSNGRFRPCFYVFITLSMYDLRHNEILEAFFIDIRTLRNFLKFFGEIFQPAQEFTLDKKAT